MRIVDLSEEIRMIPTETSSRGNQGKWHVGNLWYKMDAHGYEGLSEVIVSRILDKSNIHEFVSYDLVKIRIEGELYNGCVSEDMKKRGETLIPLQRVVRQMTNKDLSAEIYSLLNPMEAIQKTVSYLTDAGVSNAGEYITKILEVDAFTFNQDRHMNNISLIQKGKLLYPAPIYDNGDSFFSDLMYFPLRLEAEELPGRATAKPFSGSFDKQVQIAEELYGSYFKTTFSKADLAAILDQASAYYEERILRRVETLINNQMEKYRNRFVVPVIT